MKDDIQATQSNTMWNQNQRRIGLTGGIASGKSSLGKYIEKNYQLPTIDADKISHDLLKPGTIFSKQVVNYFGNSILKDNLIDRKKLAKLVFNSKENRLWIENLLHPIIKNQLINKIQLLQNQHTIILIVPLLFEANLTYLCSEIWLVYCSLKNQIIRLSERDDISFSEAKKRINSQLPMNKKKKLADHILNNDQEPLIWQKQIEILLKNDQIKS